MQYCNAKSPLSLFIGMCLAATFYVKKSTTYCVRIVILLTFSAQQGVRVQVVCVVLACYAGEMFEDRGCS